MRTTIDTSCPVCGESQFSNLYTGLVRCEECSFVTADKTSHLEDLQSLYGQQYYAGDEYADYLGDKKVIQRNLRRWLRMVRRYVAAGSLLEVGSAYGFFLELAREHFDVVGYDVSEEVASYATEIVGVPTHSRDFLSDESLPVGAMEAVVMWDVIEHLDAPDRFIDRSAYVLRPGGYLFLTTGDIDAWLPRRQGPGWRLIHPPTHLQYFSGRTITRLLSRKGFKVVRISHPGYWRSISQILHGLFVFGKTREPSGIYRVLDRLLPGRVAVYLNTFDIMFVAARKVST